MFFLALCSILVQTRSDSGAELDQIYCLTQPIKITHQSSACSLLADPVQHWSYNGGYLCNHILYVTEWTDSSFCIATDVGLTGDRKNHNWTGGDVK